MTEAQQNRFLEKLTSEVARVAELTGDNATQIAVLAEATATLKETTAHLGELYDAERGRGDVCRYEMRKDINALADSMRAEVAQKADLAETLRLEKEVASKADAEHFEKLEEMVLSVRKLVFIGVGATAAVQFIIAAVLAPAILKLL